MTVTEKIETETQEKVELLRKKLIDIMKPSLCEDNDIFHRFLTARDFNLDQTESMLRKHVEFRKEYNVDTILQEKILSAELDACIPQSIIGFDKENAPIKFFDIGNVDAKGLLMSAKFRDRVRYAIQMVENEFSILEKKSKQVGKKLSGITYIADLQNLSFATATHKPTIQEAVFLAKLYQDNYPGRLKTAILINVPSFFFIPFAIIKPFISAALLEKVKFCTTPDEWKPELLKLVDADVLPAFLGGNRTDPDGDPMCKSFVKHGRVVPTNLYIHKSTRSLVKSKDVKKLTISRASFSEIELEVTEADSCIEWEFETKTRDIGFGLFLKEVDANGEEKITELVPLLRLDTDNFSEIGLFKCEKVGTYVILFDNSYSWVRSKDIYYKINVMSPKQHQKEMKVYEK